MSVLFPDHISNHNKEKPAKKPFKLSDAVSVIQKKIVTTLKKGVYIDKTFVSTEFDDALFEENPGMALSKAYNLYKNLMNLAADPDLQLELLDKEPNLTTTNLSPAEEKAFTEARRPILEALRDRKGALEHSFNEYKGNRQSSEKRNEFIRDYSALVQSLMKNATFCKDHDDAFLFSNKNQKQKLAKKK